MMNDLLYYFAVPVVARRCTRGAAPVLGDIPPGSRGGLKRSRGRLTRACLVLFL